MMKNLTRKEVFNRWINSQGDMTLTPGDPKRNVNKKECKRSFLELIKRQVVRPPKDKVNR